MEIKRITIDHYEIEYVLEGDSNKDTLFFVHGLGTNIEQWLEQIDFFKDTHQVLAISFQGHGDSSKHDNFDDYSLDQYAKVAINLLELLQIKSCVWIGCSMGGVIGYEVLNRREDLITTLITFGTTPELIASKTFVKMIKFIDRFMIRVMGYDKYIRFAAKNCSKIKEVQESLEKIMIKTDTNAVISSHIILSNYSYLETIKSTNTDIYILQAPYDKSINKSINKNIKMLQNQSNIHFKSIPSTGHVANLDQPEGFNTLVNKIIQI